MFQFWSQEYTFSIGYQVRKVHSWLQNIHDFYAHQYYQLVFHCFNILQINAS